MCHLMYKEFDCVHSRVFVRAKSIKLHPSRLKQAVLPSAFDTEDDNILQDNKVDVTMADHLFARGPSHSRKTKDLHLT